MEPFPASPEPEHRPDDRGPAPASVQNAVRLIWASVALSVLGAVLSFVMLDDLIDTVLEGTNELTRDQARVGIIGSVVVGVVIGVALAALLAVFIGRGANWARIVWTVLAVLGLVFSLPAIGNQPPIALVQQLVGLALTVAILVLLYRPESNRYFTKKA